MNGCSIIHKTSRDASATPPERNTFVKIIKKTLKAVFYMRDIGLEQNDRINLKCPMAGN
jgi:hypothetical protein